MTQIVHSAANHVHWLVKDWIAPPVQATLPGKFQVNKKAQELTESVSAAAGKPIEFKILWTEVTGATDDKGSNASPEAMFWLVEAMIKVEGAFKDLLKLQDFKAECVPGISVCSSPSLRRSDKDLLISFAHRNLSLEAVPEVKERCPRPKRVSSSRWTTKRPRVDSLGAPTQPKAPSWKPCEPRGKVCHS